MLKTLSFFSAFVAMQVVSSAEVEDSGPSQQFPFDSESPGAPAAVSPAVTLADNEKLMHARGISESVSEETLRDITDAHPIALPLLWLLLDKIQEKVLTGVETGKKGIVTKVAFEQIVDVSWDELKLDLKSRVHDHARPLLGRGRVSLMQLRAGLMQFHINKMINANGDQVKLAKRAIVTNIWYERGIWAMKGPAADFP